MTHLSQGHPRGDMVSQLLQPRAGLEEQLLLLAAAVAGLLEAGL
jgi:hypothetical protein